MKTDSLPQKVRALGIGVRRVLFAARATSAARSLRRLRLRDDKDGFVTRYFRYAEDINWQEFLRLRQIRLERPIEVHQPLVLISQVQRSGGHLLCRLFDGHPQCHTRPQELYFGNPMKWNWPELNLSGGPEVWFRTLIEPGAYGAFEEGATTHKLPFMFLLSLQKEIFTRCTGAGHVSSRRDILNGYMTSYFNAWLDNQNLYGADKKIVTAFVPRMVMEPKSVDSYFAAYPDGKLLCIIRDPSTWCVSALRHNPKQYKDVGTALGFWCASTRSILDARQRYGERVRVIRFEDLVLDTEGTMRGLARFVGIEFHPCLLTPTFNTMPIPANTTLAGVTAFGVIREPLARDRGTLTEDERAAIESRTKDLRDQVDGLCHRP